MSGLRGFPMYQPADDDGEAALRTRAEELAKAHHAEMGVAMRRVSGKPVIVGPWSGLPVDTQLVLVAVMRALLEDGTIS